MMICDYCDLRQQTNKTCSNCGNKTRKWSSLDSVIDARVSESRGKRNYGFESNHFPSLMLATKATIRVRHRSGHPIRPAGRGEWQRKRIKSSPQNRQSG